jgi:hypothetical protein
VSGTWSAPCACRVRLPAQRALQCVECRRDRRYRRRGGCWRLYFSPHLPGRYRWCGSCADSRS